MKYTIPKIFTCVEAAIFWLTTAQAQTSTNSGGGSGTGSGGSIEYSVGQVVYTTGSGSEGSVAQGMYTLEVSKAGYTTNSQTISIKRGQKLKVVVKLEKV